MRTHDQRRADWQYSKHLEEYHLLIADAAWKFNGAAEYDDLYQEGLIALWKWSLHNKYSKPSIAIFNRMKNWVGYTKRLRHHQSVSYNELVDNEVY